MSPLLGIFIPPVTIMMQSIRSYGSFSRVLPRRGPRGIRLVEQDTGVQGCHSSRQRDPVDRIRDLDVLLGIDGAPDPAMPVRIRSAPGLSACLAARKTFLLRLLPSEQV